MTLTSKVYINFGMQSDRFTQHGVLRCVLKAFLFLAPATALHFAGLRIRHPADVEITDHLQKALVRRTGMNLIQSHKQK